MRDAERRASARIDVGPAPADAGKSVRAKSETPAETVRGKSAALGRVKSVRVLGDVDFAAEVDLAGRISSVLGDGEVTEADVASALAAVRRALAEEGYYLARASLARGGAYDAATGTLTVLADGGRFGEVKIDRGEESGRRWYSDEQIRRRLASVRPGETFEYGKLRRALYELNSHPDLKADARIDVRKPVEGEGEGRRVARYADIALAVEESAPFHAALEVNNYGMKEINRWQAFLVLQCLNLTRHDDVLTVSPSVSFGGELKSVAASYSLPHWWWRGGSTSLQGGWSDLDADDVVPRLDLEGSGWFAGLQHVENLLDADRHLVYAAAGITARNLEDRYTAAGLRLRSRDVTVLPLSLSVGYTGRGVDGFYGRNGALLQGVFNVASWGDGVDELWQGADEHYALLRWQLSRLQRLSSDDSLPESARWTLFLRLDGQYTRDTLAPVEKLSLGGPGTVRGYRTRGYIGDYGVYGTAEIRTPVVSDRISSLFGRAAGSSPLDQFQFLAFADGGWTGFNDLPSGYEDDEFLFSAGAGVRAAVARNVYVACDMAFPMHDAYGKDEDFEIYLSVRFQF